MRALLRVFAHCGSGPACVLCTQHGVVRLDGARESNDGAAGGWGKTRRTTSCARSLFVAALASSTKLGQKRAAPVVGFDAHVVVADVTRHVATHRAATRDVVIRPWLGTASPPLSHHSARPVFGTVRLVVMRGACSPTPFRCSTDERHHHHHYHPLVTEASSWVRAPADEA